MKKIKYYFNYEREDGTMFKEWYYDRKTLLETATRYLAYTLRGYYLDIEVEENEKERIVNYYITKNGR